MAPGDHHQLHRCFLEDKKRITEDGIRILPAKQLCEHLWSGEIVK